MTGRHRAGKVAALILGTLALAVGSARPALAFEWDLPGERKFSIHGFYESRLLFVGQSLPANDVTWSSFRHVLSLESELTLFPDGFGPFDSMFAFTRFMVSYECIYTRSCGTFNSADSYGDYTRKAIRQPASLKEDVKNNSPYFAGLLKQTYRPGTFVPAREELNPGRRYRDCDNPPGVFSNPFPLAAFCNLNSRSPLDGPIQGGANKLYEIRAGTFSPNSREALLGSTRPSIGEAEFSRLRGLLLNGQVLARSTEGLRRTLLSEAYRLENDPNPPADADEQAAALRQQAADLLGTPETTFDANIETLLSFRPDPNRFEEFANQFAPSLLTAQWGAGQIRNSIQPFLATINTPIVPTGYFASSQSLNYVGEYEQGLAENLGTQNIAGVPITPDADGQAVFKSTRAQAKAVPFFVGPDGRRDTADDLPFVASNPRASELGITLAPPIAGTREDRFDELQDFGLPRYTQTAQIVVPNATSGGADKRVELYAVLNPQVLRVYGCTNVGGTWDAASGTCSRGGQDVTADATVTRGCTQFALNNRTDSRRFYVGVNADNDCIQINTTTQGTNARIQFEMLPLLGDLSLRPDTANSEPLDSTDLQLFANRGEQLPARPRSKGNGLYFKSPGMRKIHEQRHDLISNLDLKYSVDELQWNHGASQGEHEFQEGYLEFEMADSQLYARLGKLIVVWGKTELFRNQDRNNPLDIGNGLFTPLEEARIGQWALDLTISPEAFMRIGPVEDMRIELLTIFDDFEPTDLGKCAEGTSVELICGKSFGSMANGLAAIGVVGERRPYQDYEGIERWDFGARVEGRFDRFTFAISDFWGWDDGFYLDLVQQYERTADLETGAPLSVNMADRTKGCKVRTNDEGVAVGPDNIAGNGDDIFASDGQCLLWSPPDENGVQNLRGAEQVAKLHTINQTLFHSVCSFTFDPDEGYCALDRVNDPRTFGAIAWILGGLGTLGGIVLDGVDTINADPRSVLYRQSGDFLIRQFQAVNPRGEQTQWSQDFGITLDGKQMALLGCGPAYASPCSAEQSSVWAADASISGSITRNPELGAPRFGGVDLMNADGGVITQDFSGLKALSPGALVGTKLNQKGQLEYLPGINYSRDGTIVQRTVVNPLSPTAPVEVGAYLDLTPDQVIRMGRKDRARYQIDPENPREADGWIEPMPWTVNQQALKKYGAIVFNANPDDPYDLGDVYTGDDESDDPDERGELRWNLIESDGSVELSNIDGEYCGRWMNVLDGDVFTPFNQGCTGLESISANFERLLIATEIIGADRVFDPPESLGELRAWGQSDTSLQAAGDPISGPDGIYANNQFVFADDEMDFSVTVARDDIQLAIAELETSPSGDKAQAEQWLLDYDPNRECTRPYCYMRVDNVLSDDDDATSTFPLVLSMPIGVSANLMSEPNDPNLPPTDTGVDTRVNLARLQRVDVGTLSRLLSGQVVAVDSPSTGTQLVQLDFNQRVQLLGALDDIAARGRDLDGDSTTDLDRDRDGVWDGIDDGTPGPVTDDNILCGSGIPGDALQDGLQYVAYRQDETPDSAAFHQAFPEGLPPRSPVFCRGVAGLVGGTTQTLPVRKAGGDGRFGRRDFLWQGGRQVAFNYQKRNVFGFGLDFAEDVTKTSWGIEYSWTARKLFGNTFEYDGLSSSDEMVLSVSVDRPTFFNFLNPNRSFFMNLQFFIRYLPGYEGGPKHNDGMYGSAGDKITGNIVFTFFTGYFQDRLAPRMSILYSPWESQGAVITGISYRWNDAFSTSIGYTQFFGHVYDQDGAYFPIAQYGSIQDYEGPVLRGVAPVLYRDQADLRIRYTW